MAGQFAPQLTRASLHTIQRKEAILSKLKVVTREMAFQGRSARGTGNPVSRAERMEYHVISKILWTIIKKQFYGDICTYSPGVVPC